jgi:hypothetical protein
MRTTYEKSTPFTKKESNAGRKFVTREDATIHSGTRRPTCIAVSGYGEPDCLARYCMAPRRPAAQLRVDRSADRWLG